MRRRASRRLAGVPVFATLPVLCLFAGPAHADVALLKNGRSLPVSDYRVQGDQILLVMEGGGQIALPSGQVLAIRREPAAPPPVTAGAPAPTQGGPPGRGGPGWPRPFPPGG